MFSFQSSTNVFWAHDAAFSRSLTILVLKCTIMAEEITQISHWVKTIMITQGQTTSNIPIIITILSIINSITITILSIINLILPIINRTILIMLHNLLSKVLHLRKKWLILRRLWKGIWEIKNPSYRHCKTHKP